MNNQADQPLRHRKTRDRALILPLDAKIAGAAALSRRLRDGGEPGAPPESQGASEQQDNAD